MTEIRLEKRSTRRGTTSLFKSYIPLQKSQQHILIITADKPMSIALQIDDLHC